jgi:NADH-quinone oxidoreductase subunit L
MPTNPGGHDRAPDYPRGRRPICRLSQPARHFRRRSGGIALAGPSLTEHHIAASHTTEFIAIGASVVAFAIGITIAWSKFGKKAEAPVFKGFASFAYHTFRVNELYDLLLVRPYKAFGSAIGSFLEPQITDGPVQLTSWFYRASGTVFKLLQTGYVRIYAIYMVIGLSIMSLLLSQSMK